MNFRPLQLESFCKNPNPQIKCIVLFGNNEGAISLWSKKCAETVCGNIDDAFHCSTLHMENIGKDSGEVYAEFYAQSLLGGRRVVIVKDADNNLTDFVKKNIPNSKSDNLLLLTSSAYNTKSSIISWAKDRDDIITCGFYEERDADIMKNAAEVMMQYGLTATPQVMQVLCSRLSPDNKINQNEIAKLAEYVGEKKNVQLSDVQVAVSDVAGANIEDLCYYTAEGKVDRACNIFERLIKEGEDVAILIRIVTNHFVKLLECRAKLDEGHSLEETLSKLHPPVIYYRKPDFIKQLKIWNTDRLLGAVQMLYNCERDCKSNSALTSELSSYTILRLSGAAQKLASLK